MRSLPPLSSSVLINGASARAWRAREIVLDGEVAVLEDRGIISIDDLEETPSTRRLEPE